MKTVAELRERGVAADLAYGDRGLKGAMKGADKSGARYTLVVGDRDLEAGVAQVKDMTTGEQEAVALTELIDTIEKRLR